MIDRHLLVEARDSVIRSDKDKAIGIARRVISEGQDVVKLMSEGFVAGIQQVGDLFGRGELFLPELVQAAEVMKIVTDIVNEALPQEVSKKGGVIIIGTVKGDVHDIGKCIVVSLLQANGFTVHDLGRDVATETFIEKAAKFDADIIGTSALLTTTMAQQKSLEEELKKAGVRDRFKTIVGGAPVTSRWAGRIGADAYAEDAQDAVQKVSELLES
ncbi:MAG: B12-binding domain-containing protein [Deltaproteobacteria bacterium]|nr:B12-binding domain-containing protein [Deltaproteobacteria bacterium]